MISLTSINTVCSSSKWLQKSKWLQNKRGATPPPKPPSKSASDPITLLCDDDSPEGDRASVPVCQRVIAENSYMTG